MSIRNFYHKTERAIVEGLSNLLRTYKKYEWWIIGILLIISITLGYLAFRNERNSWHAALYDSIRLFPMESLNNEPQTLLYYIARWLSPFTLGLIVYTTFIFLAKEKIITLRLKFYKNHTVICGLGKVGQQIAKDFLKVGKKIVIIESNDHNDYNSFFREKNVIVINENARDIKVLQKARVNQAQYLIAITHDDKQNIEIANNAIRNDNTEQNSVTCYAHVNDNNIRLLFSNQDFLSPNMFLFNINEKAMRLMLKKHAPDIFKPVKQKTDPSPKILIIGFSEIGFSLAVQLCISAYYINNQPAEITIMHDESEEKEANSFNNRYCNLLKQFDLINIKFEKCVISELSIKRFNSKNTENDDKKDDDYDVVYLCIEEEVNQYEIASRIEEFFSDKNIPMVFCLPRQYQLATILEKKYKKNQEEKATKKESSEKAKVHLFNIVDESCSFDNIINEKINELAVRCHEAYKKSNQNCKDTWESLPHFIKFSNFSQADHIDVKLRTLGMDVNSFNKEMYAKYLKDENIKNALAEMEHRRWMGVEIINQQKHHSIKPWEKLKPDVKKYDYDHINSIPDILG